MREFMRNGHRKRDGAVCCDQSINSPLVAKHDDGSASQSGDVGCKSEKDYVDSKLFT
jgi:hypothetical protein